MQRKLVITALGAFGFGTLVGWAITADIQEKKLREERDSLQELLTNKTEHIWALQDRLEQENNRVMNALAAEEETDLSPSSPEVDPNQTTISDVVTDEEIEERLEDVVPEDETPEETRTKLQGLIDTYAADPASSSEFVEQAIADDDNLPPFVIPRSTYAWDEEGEHYEKITLTYFPRDNVLLDDEEDPIVDIQRMVGWRNLSQFGGESEDPDVVFIRNRRLMTDFEVVKDEESQLPLHVRYGMEKEEFRANRAAGLIKLRQEDDDH